MYCVVKALLDDNSDKTWNRGVWGWEGKVVNPRGFSMTMVKVAALRTAVEPGNPERGVTDM